MEINFLKRKKKFRKGGLGIKPDLYWKYLLYITFTLMLLSCVFGLYLFMSINKEPVSSITDIDKKEMIGKERLIKVLEYFSEREKKSIEILNSPSPIIDPSL